MTVMFFAICSSPPCQRTILESSHQITLLYDSMVHQADSPSYATMKPRGWAGGAFILCRSYAESSEFCRHGRIGLISSWSCCSWRCAFAVFAAACSAMSSRLRRCADRGEKRLDGAEDPQLLFEDSAGATGWHAVSGSRRASEAVMSHKVQALAGCSGSDCISALWLGREGTTVADRHGTCVSVHHP